MKRLEADRPAALLSVRVQPSLDKALTKRAKQEGTSRSELVRRYLALGLKEQPSVENELRRLRDEVHALRRELREAVKPRRRKSR